MYTTTTDSSDPHDRDPDGHDAHSHSHSHSHSSSDAAAAAAAAHSHSHGGHSRTRSHRYTPSIGHSALNGYAFPPSSGTPPTALAYTSPPRPSPQEPFAAATHVHHKNEGTSQLRLSSFTTPLLVVVSLLLAELSHVASRVSQTQGGGDALLKAPQPQPQPRNPMDRSAPAEVLSKLFASAAPASGVLFVATAFGIVRQRFPDRDEGGGGGGFTRRKPQRVSARQVVMLAVAVWAPYFAAFELGGSRAAVVVLAGLAGGLGGGGGFKGLVKAKAVLGAVGIAAAWDLWRGDGPGTLLAYAGLSVGVRRAWPELRNARDAGKVSAMAACALALTSLAGWSYGLGRWNGGVGMGVLAVVAGGASMVVGDGIRRGAGSALGVLTAVAGGWLLGLVGEHDLLSESGLAGLVLAALSFGRRASDGHSHHTHDHGHDHSQPHSHSHDHDHHHHHHHHHHSAAPPSAATQFLLRKFGSWPLMHGILVERDSRRIFYFMCLNFLFMLVQTIYGYLTGSLGLISDSVHMFFDCMALGVGVSAAVMSKWPPSARYPYGLSKMDTLAGFANGIFLMLISIEIVWEAFERLKAPTEMSRLTELFVVSTAGLAVNMVGIFAFDHAHAGHGHSHDGHDHHHGHNDNMHGIFLHILADALGSVSVVISTLLIQYTNWPGFDPLASMLIAVLIFASSVPLVKSAARNLLLTVDATTEYTLRETIAGIATLPGVRGYRATRFWETGSHKVVGVVHVVAEGEKEVVRNRVEEWCKNGLGEEIDVCVVVEGEAEAWCWCRKE